MVLILKTFMGHNDQSEEVKREQGIVVFLNDEKGYGFIEVVNYPKNIFFHAKDLRHITFEKIRKGDSVEVEGIKKTERGFNVSSVYLVS